MRHFPRFVTAMLFGAASLATTFGQGHETPGLNGCIKEFYDPEMYNWLTFRNSCTESLTIVFVAKDQSGVSGTMDLRPGGKDSVGSMKGVVPKVGQFEIYVCRLGYEPVDGENKVVSKPGTSVRCQPKK